MYADVYDDSMGDLNCQLVSKMKSDCGCAKLGELDSFVKSKSELFLIVSR